MYSENLKFNRRRWLTLAGAAGSGLLFVSGQSGSKTGPASAVEPVSIKITAQKFKYTPNQIVLKKGQATVLEFTSVDFVHGFNLPDLKIRADLIPGRITKVELNIDQEGVYEFLCDNFCGDGHEEMSGKITVTT